MEFSMEVAGAFYSSQPHVHSACGMSDNERLKKRSDGHTAFGVFRTAHVWQLALLHS